ncbi:hypothetical protein HDV00_004664 [Rhizophlyctis rosea]|nr:hypothetical protein HDV00_004664 [Rhizophlyctis rosea]
MSLLQDDATLTSFGRIHLHSDQGGLDPFVYALSEKGEVLVGSSLKFAVVGGAEEGTLGRKRGREEAEVLDGRDGERVGKKRAGERGASHVEKWWSSVRLVSIRGTFEVDAREHMAEPDQWYDLNLLDTIPREMETLFRDDNGDGTETCPVTVHTWSSNDVAFLKLKADGGKKLPLEARVEFGCPGTLVCGVGYPVAPSEEQLRQSFSTLVVEGAEKL